MICFFVNRWSSLLSICIDQQLETLDLGLKIRRGKFFIVFNSYSFVVQLLQFKVSSLTSGKFDGLSFPVFEVIFSGFPKKLRVF